MTYANRIKETTASTSTATIALGGQAAGFKGFAAKYSVGAAGIEVLVGPDASGAWLLGVYTYTDATTLTRTSIIDSSAGGADVTLAAGAKDVVGTISADSLNAFLNPTTLAALGTPLTTYLASNPGSSVGGTDTLLVVQGGQVVAVSASALADYVLSRLTVAKEVSVPINTTTAFPLDFATHNRRRLLCSAAATINAPAVYSSVGDGFTCKVTNISGGAVTFGSGISVLPSGTTLPNNATADVFAAGGALYAQLVTGNTSSGSTVAPGQVTGLSLGTATASSLPASWTAPTTGTTPFTYTVQYRVTGQTAWTTASSTVTGTSYTITGLTASTSYDVQVIASNSAGNGTASTTATKSTASAAPPAAPFTAVARANFPSAQKTYSGDYHFQDLTATGSATIVSANSAVSTSNTVVPTSAIAMGGSGIQGVWFGAMTQYGSPSTTYIDNGSSSISASVPNPTAFYYWVIITDSNGATWNFVYPNPITFGDTVTPAQRGSTMTATQV